MNPSTPSSRVALSCFVWLMIEWAVDSWNWQPIFGNETLAVLVGIVVGSLAAQNVFPIPKGKRPIELVEAFYAPATFILLLLGWATRSQTTLWVGLAMLGVFII